MKKDIVVIGAGITGMTCAYELHRKGKDIQILECQNRIGGQINTQKIGNFTFESGPNTGVLKHPEVAELFEQLGDACTLETARESSKRRLVWKGDKFHALPSSLATALKTPLFTWYDKFRILGEPWRKKGNAVWESRMCSMALILFSLACLQVILISYLFDSHCPNSIISNKNTAHSSRAALPRQRYLRQNAIARQQRRCSLPREDLAT